jgi:glutathione S-transferase
MKLIIGNKNYSSWSLRAYMALSHTGAAFEEEKISFNDRTWKGRLGTRLVPAKVPMLIDGERVIWDTLAILEYLAERFPESSLWPTEPHARAVARSAAAEMHSSYTGLRRHLPMNVMARLPGLGWNNAVEDDVRRICDLWGECRERFGAEGPYLFGRFSNADAMFAPVASRFVTYAVPLPPHAEAYVAAALGTDAYLRWSAEAAGEDDFVAMDEPYRRPAKS